MNISKSIGTFLCILCLPVFLYAQYKDSCPTIGVVLSGGGAKGYAHIGALEVLEKNYIYPDKIAGTSMGAIIGGLYASGYTAKQLDSLVHQIDLSEVLRSPLDRRFIPFFDKKYAEKYILQLPFDNFKFKIPSAISKGQGTKENLSNLTRHVNGVENFKNLSTPFFCIATDLDKGEQVILDHRNLANALLASSAFPGLIPPQKIGSKFLLDGGVVNNLPVKEIREQGAKIVIAIDLGSEKINWKNRTNLITILEQISTFKNEDYIKKQRKLANVLVKVDVKDYNEISFGAKKELIQRGAEAVEKQIENIFKLIPPDCRSSKNIRPIKHDVKVSDSVMIKGIDIKGSKHYSFNYIKSKLDLQLPKKISYSEIKTAVSRLYATDNFSKIDYSIDNHSQRLKLNLIENRNKIYLKMGFHYDNAYKTAFLTNLTVKNILFKNSSLSTDFILGDRFRFNLNYFIDNGLKPSFGFNSYYKNIEFESIFKEVKPFKLPFRFQKYVTQTYLQSTIFNRYAFGIGIEYENITIKGPSRSLSPDPLHHYLGPYAYIKVDNRDQPNFSKKGTIASIKYKLLPGIIHNTQFNSYLMAKTESNFFIHRRFTFKLNGGLGMRLSDNELPVEQQFYIGGFNEQPFNNYQKLYGYDFMEIKANNYFLIGAGIQYNVVGNHYISLFANTANTSQYIEKMNPFNITHYNGIDLQYAYNSILGPIILNYSYSPARSKGEFYLSLGFWF